MRRAPAVADFGAAGVRGAYQFVTQDATDEELLALIQGTDAHGFEPWLLTVNMNGLDTTFAQGPTVLYSQDEVDAEFRIACAIGRGHVYLTHVRYNPADETGDEVRTR